MRTFDSPEQSARAPLVQRGEVPPAGPDRVRGRPSQVERVDRRTAFLVIPFFVFGGFVIPFIVEAFKSLAGRRFRLRTPHVVALFVGAYLAINWAFVRTAHLTGPPEPLVEFIRWQLREIAPLVAVLLTVLMRPQGLVDRYARALIAVGAIIGFLGALEYIEVLALDRDVSFLWLVRHQADGSYLFGAALRAHNAAGGLYAALAALSLWWFFEHRVRFWVLGGNVLALVMTLSRSGYLGFIVVAGIYLFFWSRQIERRRRVWATVGGVVGVSVLFGPMYQRFVQAFSPTDFSRTSRLQDWSNAFHDFAANPVFGIGWGNYQPAPGEHAHNSYLQVLAELGTIGFILLAWWLGSVLVELYRAGRLDIIGAIGTVMVSAFLDHNFGSPTMTAPVFLLAGMAITGYRTLPEGRTAAVVEQGSTDPSAGEEDASRRLTGPGRARG